MMDDTPVSLLEDQVDEVIAEYLEAERAGLAPDPDEFIARHPEFADELQSFFSDRACFAQVASPRLNFVARQRSALQPTIDAGRYVNLAPHAHGGMSEVCTATDTELHRRVAVKRLQERLVHDAASQRRFLLEAEITARLEHPGVVPVHSLYWDDQDRPCYTMRFIEGQTLAEALKDYHAGPADAVVFRRLLQSFIQVCETVAYAHSRGVIHRDLKPQNIMLGKFGETQVVDWGLAKVVGRAGDDQADNPETTLRPLGDSDGSGDRAQMGSAVGTPAYMSPEQAAGRWDVIDTASDVYNLGAVLYAILTGRAPLEGSNWPELQQKIQRGEFPRPRSVKPTVPRALEAVCLRAMAMKPEERYESARGLAADVEFWLADEPVKAYPEPVRDQVWRWMKRHKGLVGGGISVFVALLTLVAGTWIVILEREKATRAETGLKQAQSEKTRLDFAGLQPRFDKLDKSIRANLDQLAVQLSQDPRLDSPDDQMLRKGLLRQLLTFWDEAIKIDSAPLGKPGWRTEFYNVQKALCLARLGEYQRAVEVANIVESAGTPMDTPANSEFEREKSYDLSRLYALCAALTKDRGELSEQYGEKAMNHLRAVAEAGYFTQAARAHRLQDDRDFDSLRPRDEFRNLLRKVQPNLK